MQSEIAKIYQNSIKKLKKDTKNSSNERDPLVSQLNLLRQKKLKDANQNILKQYIERYREEQKEIMMIGINLSANEVSLLDKVFSFLIF